MGLVGYFQNPSQIYLAFNTHLPQDLAIKHRLNSGHYECPNFRHLRITHEYRPNDLQPIILFTSIPTKYLKNLWLILTTDVSIKIHFNCVYKMLLLKTAFVDLFWHDFASAPICSINPLPVPTQSYTRQIMYTFGWRLLHFVPKTAICIDLMGFDPN